MFKIQFPSVPPLKEPLVTCEDLKFGYSYKKLLLQDVNFRVDSSSRIGLMGANGVGKSTFLKLLLDKLVPLSGYVHRNRNARVAYFSQHHVDQLDLNKCPLGEREF